MLYFTGYLVTCWIAADFLSGVFHWLEDRYARESWPIIGKYIAAPNELHHRQPSAFLAGSYWKRNWTTLAATLPFFVLLFPGKWCLVLLFASQANEIHAWAHQRCGGWVRVFQSTGILQSSREHGLHHHSPYAVRYCVMSDWLNPILDELKFWRFLEKLIEFATGGRLAVKS